MKQQNTSIPELTNKWVRRRSFVPFYIDGKPNIALQIKKAFKMGKSIQITGGHRFPVSDFPIIITQEEAIALNKMRQALQLSPPIDQEIEKTCFTTYTGERKEKVKFTSERRVLDVVFQKNMLNPEKHFEGYLCPNCNFFHIGKPE